MDDVYIEAKVEWVSNYGISYRYVVTVGAILVADCLTYEAAVAVARLMCVA